MLPTKQVGGGGGGTGVGRGGGSGSGAGAGWVGVAVDLVLGVVVVRVPGLPAVALPAQDCELCLILRQHIGHMG